MTDARADFSRAGLAGARAAERTPRGGAVGQCTVASATDANRGARLGERRVELTLNPGGQAVHRSHDGCYRT